VDPESPAAFFLTATSTHQAQHPPSEFASLLPLQFIDLNRPISA
jgi:hypothetical protein